MVNGIVLIYESYLASDSIDNRSWIICGANNDKHWGKRALCERRINFGCGIAHFVPMANQASLDGVNWLESRRKKNVFPSDLDPAIPICASSPWKSQLGMSLSPSQVATVALGLFGAFGRASLYKQD